MFIYFSYSQSVFFTICISSFFHFISCLCCLFIFSYFLVSIHFLFSFRLSPLLVVSFICYLTHSVYFLPEHFVFINLLIILLIYLLSLSHSHSLSPLSLVTSLRSYNLIFRPVCYLLPEHLVFIHLLIRLFIYLFIGYPSFSSHPLPARLYFM